MHREATQTTPQRRTMVGSMMDDRPNGLTDTERRLRYLERGLRDMQETMRRMAGLCERWEPIIETARDQDYLRTYVERRELEDAKRHGLRFTHTLGLFVAVAGWTGTIAAVVTLILR